MTVRTARPLLSSVLALALAACPSSTDGDGGPTGPVAVASVAMSASQATVEVGQTTQLSATARDAAGNALTGRTIAWSSSNNGVATVSATGLVTGVGAGTANIVATSEGRTGTAQVTVTPVPVASVEVTPTTAELDIGGTEQLTATTRDSGGNVLTGRTVTWASSATSVATVNGSGLVTAVGVGTATVTATSEGQSATAVVTVTQEPVAAVEVTPDPAEVVDGQTVQLTATARDAAGNVLSGRAFSWATSDAAVATVSATGLVTGVDPGDATITASAEGIDGDAAVTVVAPPPVVITALPASVTEGQTITVTGTGFSATASENTVTVDGTTAIVTQASTSSLVIVVPTFQCLPKRIAPVRVTVGGATSDDVQTTVSPTSFLQLSVGGSVLLQDPGDLCLQFDEGAGAERYVVGVQSVSEAVSDLTDVRVLAQAAVGAVPAPPLQLRAGTAEAGPAMPFDLARATRWQAHREAEGQLMERARRQLEPLVRSGAFQSSSTAPARIPPTVNVGDQVVVQYPNFSGNLCTDFTDITVVVRKVSARAIIVEELGNPANGFEQQDWDDMAADFDNKIYPNNVDVMGEPSDLDSNDRIVVVVSKSVNEVGGNLLAWVSFGDLFTQTQCVASNEGEYYYTRAPDPLGDLAAGVYTLDDARNDVQGLLAHEFAHIQQGSRRLAAGGQFMTSYMAEGGATAMEQFNGFFIEGRPEGQNLEKEAVYNAFGAPPQEFYGFIGDLLGYFGYDFGQGHAANAPHECTWVGSPGNSPGPCGRSDRLPYGVTFSLVQHGIDLHGDGLGGSKAVHSALVDFAGTPGFPAIESVFGVSVAELMSTWAPMLYIDDRFVGPGLERYQFKNFNIRSVEDAWGTPAARLAPTLVGFEDSSTDVFVRSASTAFFDLSGAGRPATSVRVTDQSGNELPGTFQLVVVRVE